MFDDWLERPDHERRKIYDQAFEQVGLIGVKRLEKAVRQKIDQRTAGGPFALRKAFKYFDRDGSGDIDPDEFVAAMEHFGLTFTDHEVLALFGQCDTTASGALDYYEFIDRVLEKDFIGFGNDDHLKKNKGDQVEDTMVNLMENVEAMEHKKRSMGAFELYRQQLALKKVFKLYDVDHSGAIDKDEMLQLLTMAGVEPDEDLVDMAFEHIDDNCDGAISFDEVWHWWLDNTTIKEKEKLRALSPRLNAKDGLASSMLMGDTSNCAAHHVEAMSNSPRSMKFHTEDTPMTAPVPPIDFGSTYNSEFGDTSKSWVTPIHTGGRSLRPMYKENMASTQPLIPKPPPAGSSKGVPEFRMPEQKQFHSVMDSPRVPPKAMNSVTENVFGRGKYGATSSRKSSGAQTARSAASLPKLNVGRFVEAPDTNEELESMEKSFISSSQPWAPRTARPHAEHNVANTSWFGGKFQNSTTSGFQTSRLPKELKQRSMMKPSLQADGRPRVKTGFRQSTANPITGTTT